MYLLTGDAGGADMKIKKGGVVCIEFDDAPKPEQERCAGCSRLESSAI